MSKPKLVISSGAGISAESGISTFRDAGGLWENYPVMEVCSADGFARNPRLVHDFYNARRKDLVGKEPNAAHKILAQLEEYFDVYVITQNVDDLHERAGSSKILHLHGELMKMRSIAHPDYVESLDMEHLETSPETLGKNGDLMRPHIVFFQETVPNMELAQEWVNEADIFVVIGTSLNVYPAAGLLHSVRPGVPIFYIDPNPANIAIDSPKVTVIKAKATEGLKILQEILMKAIENTQQP
ncbi:MAG: NAD-dependent protein deacylase [Muribaculaceae bacterium]|nr:NAD-dependent protein deacylase [Muribaculaceae bacterium]